ncbi:MAG TPA: alpha/beta fold hydrolase [Anaeromyxobacter sp.]|nr:alpha/beta fold hydrolase [Anaeromyxobacter sp.]
MAIYLRGAAISLSPAIVTEARALLLFAPGAGAPSTSPWMERWASRLATIGDVVRFDYPYVKAGRKSPDKLPALVAAHRAALAEARAARSDRPVVLVGKSMGGRVGCHVALEEQVAAVVCLGYPLVGQRGEMRSEVLLALRVPALFVQGSKDPLCPIERLEEVRARMTAPTALHVVDAGNHSLLLGARTLAARHETQEDVDGRAMEAVARFVAGAGLPRP